MKSILRRQQWCGIALALALVTTVFVKPSSAQDSDDPPARVARLGYIQGSVSFRPAGEDDWVGAVPNRPMTTGDSIWADENSRAEVQLGSAVIRLAPMSGFSFLNLDDNTVQIQLTSGALNVTVRRMDGDDDFEVDTPNLAFSALQPGHYRLEASNDGNYTVVSVRQGEGEADGGGQSFPLRAGQRGTFSSSGSGNENDQLYADVEAIYEPDDFDVWSQGRDHRYESARSAQYLSPDVVGYDDLDENGDWRDDPQYGHVWFPHIEAGWAPYHAGHWAWIAPWGWTWVDDASWGYAPFHYGRWVFATGRWGWIAGPPAVRAVYAPALVVFIGGGPGGFGGNVGWFPLGPREVYVPSYHVSAAYVNRVNVSNTTVNVTQVTNVYNTTIVRNTTVIQNVTYVNRDVRGGVTAVPQAAFVSAQPVARAAVVMNAREINAAPVSVRMAMVPTHASVVGPRVASGTVRVAAPPAAIVNRQVVAKRTPPPPPVSFARQQQALAAHPGEPLARNEVATLRPAAMAHPAVKVAPPAKPATPNMGRPAPNTPAARPGNPQPATNPAAGSTGGRPAVQPNQPMQPNRPENNRPANAPENNARPQPNAPVNRPQPNQPQPNRPQPNQPQPNQPANRPENTAPARPATPPANPETNRPEMNRPNQPNTNQPNNRPQPNRPEPNRPQPDNRPETNRPVQPTQPPVRNDRPATPTQPLKNTPPNNQPPARPQTPPPAQPRTPPPAARPTPPPARQQPQQKPKPQTPEEKKRQQEEKPSGV
jgi:hypothetical protein